ncbi:hypothetical protein MMC32_001278 [Xylographa parallela]|nr:hypothetical protein [Xylographa parallela]
MLDSFEILTTSGVVLWSRSYDLVGPSIINGLIRDVFIEEKVLPGASVADDASAARNPPYKKDKYTLKWTTVKDLGLIFVAVYQSLLQISWIDKLLDNVKTIFVELYGDQLRKPHTSVVECDFDAYFDQQLRELEGSVDSRSPPLKLQEKDLTPSSSSDTGDEPPPPIPGLLYGKYKLISINATSIDATPIPTPDTSRPTTPLVGHLLSGSAGPKGSSRRAKKAAALSANISSGEETSRRKSKPNKAAPKKLRKWDADGFADEDDEVTLDYSATSPGVDGGDGVGESAKAAVEDIRSETFGTRTGKGQFVLKDLDNEVHSILQGANAKKASDTTTPNSVLGSSLGAISGLFRNIVGGKVLTKADLEKPMRGIEEHLLKKNVAREAAVRLCEGVERELIAVKTGSFESVEATIRTSMESSLRKILTPTTSLDLLRAITSTTSPSALNPLASRRPYVISIVGVNGVGKSTNLSKLAFFLLQNDFKILIAACDTFRSGAVEQLRVHARNLKELAQREGRGEVELFEKGYGKDAANIAKDAVAYAAAQQFDVVLIDTAGRRHNDARLMSNLEKFGQLANPDKIFMVGEALVGSDSVAQARNFNAAFGAGRHLDGFIISKCDTVGDMVGSLVSMVHATGIPVVFLGVGQHYGDLRTLNVGWAVGMLMS